MRDLLSRADLSRYAGQFVWLELSYDEPRNRDFMAKYGPNATPTFFVISPFDEKVLAMQSGVMSLAEVERFLERGTAAIHPNESALADAALARGDRLMARQPADAAKAYLEALQLAKIEWPHRELAQASAVQALQDSNQFQQCAETAFSYGSTMKRDVFFVRTVASGMWCLASAGVPPWLDAQVTKLQPLAEEALSLPITVRDHRDSIYRTLMYIAVARNDNATALKWGDRWLTELDQITPHTDDERAALDIARVENLQIAGDPVRILPALRSSEKAMPDNYIASLRLAQMELAAKQYDTAIATCRRGLLRKPGAVGQTWLLRIEARARQEKGQVTEARELLLEALKTAEQIPSKESRENTISSIRKALESTQQH